MKIKERELLKKLFDAINLLDYRQGLDPLTCEIEELLAQPEQPPITPRQGLEEYKKGYAQAELDLKREPLSESEIFNAWIPSKATPCVHSFKAGVKFAEKEHGVGVSRV